MALSKGIIADRLNIRLNILTERKRFKMNALEKGFLADGSDALWNGDLLQSRATSKGIIADSSYRESAKICGYGDVVGAINKGTKFCDGCSTVFCIYRIVILVIAIAGCTSWR